MIDFLEIFNSIKDFYKEKKIVAIISTVLISLFLIALVCVIVQTSSSPKKNKSIPREEAILVPDQKLLLPQAKTYSNEYALTREPKEKWDEEEAKKYFTVPSSKELNELEKSNDKLIDEILGETP
jgi:hypothetical protein